MISGLLIELWILLTVVSYRIARTFSRFSVTRAAALNISKASYRVLHTGFIQKVKSLKFKVGFLVLFRHFLLIDALEKLSQEYPVYDGVPEDCVLGPTKKKKKKNRASELWQQLELASDLESYLGRCDRK